MLIKIRYLNTVPFVISFFSYGFVSQWLGTTEVRKLFLGKFPENEVAVFAYLISWNRNWKRSWFSHLDQKCEKRACKLKCSIFDYFKKARWGKKTLKGEREPRSRILYGSLRRGYTWRLFSSRLTQPFCRYLGHVSSDAKSLCLFH